MLKIQMLPRYTAAAASSRLRVYHLAGEMNSLGLADCHLGRDLPAGWTPDVVYMQKLGSAELIRGHARALYDFDDIWDPGLLAEAAEHVQAFTVDTPGHGSLAPKRCELVPDMIDYGMQRPWPAASAANRICWFGNAPNFESARRLMLSAVDYAYVEVISERPPDAPFYWTRWSYESFTLDLRSSGTAFLSHAGADHGKSANKMIAAITMGVPCIVHDSPAYEQLARVAGLNDFIVKTAGELRAAWRRLQDTTERERYLDAIQPIVWSLYRPERIARRFADVCNSLL